MAVNVIANQTPMAKATAEKFEAPTLDVEAFEEVHRDEIEAGIARGLADVEAGRTFEATPEFLKDWTARLKAKHTKN